MDMIAIGWSADNCSEMVDAEICSSSISIIDMSWDTEISTGLEEFRRFADIGNLRYLANASGDDTSNKLANETHVDILSGKTPKICKLVTKLESIERLSCFWLITAFEWYADSSLAYMTGKPSDLEAYLKFQAGIHRYTFSVHTGQHQVDDTPLVWKLVNAG